MKKFLFFSICLLLVIASLGLLKKQDQIASSFSYSDAVSCYPGTVDNPTGTIKAIRKSVYKLLPAEQDSLRVAFARMKANTNPNDPTSWIYQTSIHGTLSTSLKTLWNSSKYAHSFSGEGYQYFLSWHRMYLYFFEKILISYQKNKSLRLPYWDPLENVPSDDTRFPKLYATERYDSVYKKKTAPNKGSKIIKNVSNPLYNSTRRNEPYPIKTPGQNDVDEYDSYEDAVNSVLNYRSYCDFLYQIQNKVHHDIHAYVGGGTGDISKFLTAPSDPAFFLHHANIDRLWERWVKKVDTQNNTAFKNPSDGDFASTYFSFYDEKKILYKVRGIDIVDTWEKLRYRYSGINNTAKPLKPNIANCCVSASSGSRLMRTQTPQPLTNNNTSISLNNFSITNPSQLTTVLTGLKANQRIIIEFEDVTVTKFPDGIIYVYFVRENEQAGTLSSICGSLNLLNLTMKHNPSDKSNLRVDITEVFKKMNLSLSTVKNTKLILKNSYNQIVAPSVSFNAINVLLETKN
jgi:Common central domain of tyrosinase/Polyphenol oxidase middle domain